MKNLISLFGILLVFFSCSKPASNVSYITETFEVLGNCDMCKSKIEKAVMITGVKSAVWNKTTKKLTIQYAPSKVDIMSIHQKIADAGYDTEKLRADNKTYNKLHSCCKYDRKD